jgi:hypothetical protein
MRPRDRREPLDDRLLDGALTDPEARRDLVALAERRRQYLRSRGRPEASGPNPRWFGRRRIEGVQVTLNVRALVFTAVLSGLVATLAWSFSWEWSYSWITRIFEALSLALVFLGLLGPRR